MAFRVINITSYDSEISFLYLYSPFACSWSPDVISRVGMTKYFPTISGTVHAVVPMREFFLWSWGSRPSHRWGGLHDIIYLGRCRTLRWDARCCWKCGGLEFLDWDQEGVDGLERIKYHIVSAWRIFFRTIWVTSSLFGGLNLVGSLLRLLFVENVHNC